MSYCVPILTIYTIQYRYEHELTRSFYIETVISYDCDKYHILYTYCSCKLTRVSSYGGVEDLDTMKY